jgi:NAD(P)-dependent dehydrogenase (short-subunit alcohol dehydrogenase family)
MLYDFAGKTVVVIGGTSGIGRAVAEASAQLGAKVIVGSSRAETVDRAKAAGADARIANVKDEDSLGKFFAGVGAFDHLVYTAGDWGSFGGGGPISELDLSKAADAFTVRFWGAIASIKHAHKYLSKSGSFTVTDGMIAHRPRRGAPVSVAMAGAIEHLVRGLSVELAPLRVNGVCPGYITTERWASLPEEVRTNLLKNTSRYPLPRGGEPSEAAAAYLYLMSAGYTTGQVLKVEGGMSWV